MEMCEREHMFCDLLIFRSGLKWCRCGNHYFFLHLELNGATFSTSWFFELLPKVFCLSYLSPTCPTQPIKAGIKPVQ